MDQHAVFPVSTISGPLPCIIRAARGYAVHRGADTMPHADEIRDVPAFRQHPQCLMATAVDDGYGATRRLRYIVQGGDDADLIHSRSAMGSTTTATAASTTPIPMSTPAPGTRSDRDVDGDGYGAVDSRQVLRGSRRATSPMQRTVTMPTRRSIQRRRARCSCYRRHRRPRRRLDGSPGRHRYSPLHRRRSPP